MNRDDDAAFASRRWTWLELALYLAVFLLPGVVLALDALLRNLTQG